MQIPILINISQPALTIIFDICEKEVMKALVKSEFIVLLLLWYVINIYYNNIRSPINLSYEGVCSIFCSRKGQDKATYLYYLRATAESLFRIVYTPFT